MARTADLSDIKNRVLWRADLPLTTTRIDTTAGGELETQIQEAAAELWEEIAQFFEEDYLFAEMSMATTAGVRYVALPSDHYKTLSVWWTPTGTTTPAMLETFPAAEEYERAATPYWNSTVIPRIRERTSYGTPRLYLEPTPDAVYTLTIQYIRSMPVIDSGSEPFPGVNGWDEWIVTRVAIWAVDKDDRDSSELRADLKGQTERVRRNASRRNVRAKSAVWRRHVPRWRERTLGQVVRRPR